MERTPDVAIIGAGTAGLAALAQLRRAGKRFVLIDGGELGTTCARVGCMPSKAMIQLADELHQRRRRRWLAQAAGSLDAQGAAALEHVRELRDIFVDRVLAGTTDEMDEEFIPGYAEFIEPTVLKVNGEIIRARRVIIATGSRPSVPSAWSRFGDRILTTDNLFELPQLPRSLAVVGLGVIGIELGQALHRLGVELTGLDQLETVGGLQDPLVARTAIEILGGEFPIWLGEAARLQEANGGVRVHSGARSITVEAVLASLGRVPNVERLGLERAGVQCDARGVPQFDPHTLQVGDLPLFIAGDVTGEKAILHECADEGRIAGFNAAREAPIAFKRKPPLMIAFCDPNIAVVGVPYSQLDPAAVVCGEMRLGPVGRALIMGQNRGVLRVYAEHASGRLLGAAMIAPRAEHLAHALAWAIDAELTVDRLLQMPYYHPSVEEALQAALLDLASKLEQRGEDPPGLTRLESGPVHG